MIFQGKLKDIYNFIIPRKIQILVFCFFFTISSLMSVLKIKSFGITYFDTGYFLNLINSIEVNNFKFDKYTVNDEKINNHLSYILLLLSILLKNFSLNNLISLSIINSLIICSCIFFFNKKNYLAIFAYCLFPLNWFNILNGFKVDTLCMPLIFGIYKCNEKNYRFLFIFLSMLLIILKFYFIIIVLGFLLYNFLQKKTILRTLTQKIFVFFLIFYFFIFISFILENKIENQFIIFNNTKEILNFLILKIQNINLYLLFFILYGYFFFLSLFNRKNIIILPIALFLIFFPNNDSLVKFYYHYSMPIIPIIMSIFNECYKNSLGFTHYKKKIIYVNFIIFHIIFSPSVFSLIFWKNINPLYYYEIYLLNNSYSKSNNNLTEILNNDHSIKNISIENSIVSDVFLSGYAIKIFPEIKFKNNQRADLVILKNKEPHFIYDERKCNSFKKECENKTFLKIYDDEKKLLEKEYQVKYRDSNLIVYKKN
jgi:hypothetical protein